jgi:hypothetical protein
MKIRYLTGGMTSLTYTRLPMTEIAAQTAYNANPTYDADIKKASEIWSFLTAFGGDVTLGFEHRVQILFECNTKVTSK